MYGDFREGLLRKGNKCVRYTAPTLLGSRVPNAYDTTARGTMFVQSSMAIAPDIGRLQEILPPSLSRSGLIATTP